MRSVVDSATETYTGKGTAFRGMAAGAGYVRLASVLGMERSFYEAAVGDTFDGHSLRALDLGCGPGSLTLALARRVDRSSEIHGIDISTDQLRYARSRAHDPRCEVQFHRCSMDAIPFPGGWFDLVMTSMALHGTPPSVRRAAIREAARLLRPGGTFLLVDWGRPRLGALGLLWLPMVAFGETNKDNWNNTYPALCARQGLARTGDSYLNSIARRQVFRKKGVTHAVPHRTPASTARPNEE